MLCDKCKKNTATTHLKRSVNGQTTEFHLCSYCAAQMGYLHNNGIVDMLASMFSESLLLNPASSNVRCKTCGATFNDIASLGKAGCPNCYETFENELKSSLNNIHGNVSHIGKKPNSSAFTVTESKPAPVKTNEQKEAELKQLLKKAIAEENFEEAAKLRDLIKELKGEE